MDGELNSAQVSLSAVQRYFEISLYLLVTTGILAILATGKLDLFTTIAAPCCWSIKASACGAGANTNSPKAWPPGWCSPISSFSPSICGFSRAT